MGSNGRIWESIYGLALSTDSVRKKTVGGKQHGIEGENPKLFVNQIKKTYKISQTESLVSTFYSCKKGKH